MLAADSYTQRFASRLAEFFESRAAWNRRLWSAGIVLELEELAEASLATAENVLSREAVSWLGESILQGVGGDLGLGNPHERRLLKECLVGSLPPRSEKYYQLLEITRMLDASYLTHWADKLSETDHGVGIERASRILAAHLLDAGHSFSALSTWLRWLRKRDQEEHDVPSIFRQADMYRRKRAREYTVFVFFSTRFPKSLTPPPEWFDGPVARRQFNHPAVQSTLFQGLLHLKVSAHDPEAAVGKAAQITDNLVARSRVGTRDELMPHGEAVVTGWKPRYPLHLRRGVEVHSLMRQDALAGDLYIQDRHSIDSALILASHADAGASEIAVGAAWSAVESLLTAPGDENKVGAAARSAALVSCSWPRAELTTLAYARIAARTDNFSAELAALDTNRERAGRVADEIHRKGGLGVALDGSSENGVRRVAKVMRDPHRQLMDVQGYVEASMRRLYRQRNLVLHGGRTEGVGLQTALRTAPPLLGATLDRIVHGYLVSKTTPLVLAARAAYHIARVSTQPAPFISALLE